MFTCKKCLRPTVSTIFGMCEPCALNRKMPSSQRAVNAINEEIDKNPILTEVQQLLITQTSKGLEKYGRTVQTDDYSLVEWIDHTLQEKVDEIVYLVTTKHKIMERMKEDESPRK